MPLSKRRRLFTPKKHKTKPNIKEQEEAKDNEVTTARGRLKGALMEMLEPTAEESDASTEYTPMKRERNASNPDQKDESTDDDELSNRRKSPQRQSYVLKLFDRSVDLSQFSEDSPLYPICRAWIANQPKANYKDFGKKLPEPKPTEDSVDLPGPEGPPISRIPDLIPEQKACSKNNINLNYREALPSKEQLLHEHVARWAGVRSAWLERAAQVEARYSAAQAVLNSINGL